MRMYKQTTEYTTAVSSFMMIINHLDPDIQLDRALEFDIWKKTVNLPTRAPSIYGLALYAHNLNFNVKVIVEEREYNYPDYRFKGYTKKEIDEAKFMSKLYAKKLGKTPLSVEEREISATEIIEFLNKGSVLLLRVNAGIFRDTGSTSKYLSFLQENNGLWVYDPVKGKRETNVQELKKSLETLESKKKRDKRVIVFNP